MRRDRLPYILAAAVACVPSALFAQSATADSVSGRMPVTVPFSMGQVAQTGAQTLQALGYSVVETFHDEDGSARLITAPRFTWPSYLGNVAALDRSVPNPGFTLELVVSPTSENDSTTFEVRMRYATPPGHSFATQILPMVSTVEVAAAVCTALDSSRSVAPNR